VVGPDRSGRKGLRGPERLRGEELARGVRDRLPVLERPNRFGHQFDRTDAALADRAAPVDERDCRSHRPAELVHPVRASGLLRPRLAARELTGRRSSAHAGQVNRLRHRVALDELFPEHRIIERVEGVGQHCEVTDRAISASLP